MARSLTPLMITALTGAMLLGGAARAAESADSAPPVRMNVRPGDKPAFAGDGAGGARHLATGFVCTAKLAGLPLTSIGQDHGADADGSGTCNYGRPADEVLVAVQLSPQESMSKQETLAYSMDMSGLPSDAPDVAQFLPLGAPGGPELGRVGTVGDGTLGVWVAFKDKWFAAVIIAFTGKHEDLAKAAGTAAFKAFQDGKPAAP